MNKVSYALGLGIGQQLKSMGAQDLCIDDFAQAIKDVLENKELAVSHHEAQSIVTQYFQEKDRYFPRSSGRTVRFYGKAGNTGYVSTIFPILPARKNLIKTVTTAIPCKGLQLQ